MPWFKLDDGFDTHPKVLAAGNEAVGLFIRCGAYVSRALTDGFVPDGLGRMYGSSKQLDRLLAVGLFERAAGHVLGDGWLIHDYLDYNPSRDQVLAQRRSDAARQTLSRDPELRAAVRDRDGDICRYCGRAVRFKDRRGAAGGTYDHVDPIGGTTLSNLVVACRGCNARKGRRTPEQAGMPLADLDPTRVVTRSDLDRKSRLTSSPDPTRPDPTSAAAAADDECAAAAAPLEASIDVLRSKLQQHTPLRALRFDTLTVDQQTRLVDLIAVHGDARLVQVALDTCRNPPPVHVSAFLGTWAALPAPGGRRLAAVPDPPPAPTDEHAAAARRARASRRGSDS